MKVIRTCKDCGYYMPKEGAVFMGIPITMVVCLHPKYPSAEQVQCSGYSPFHAPSPPPTCPLEDLDGSR